MDVSKMKTLTTSKECTGKVNDEDLYLAWPRMKWNITGNIQVFNESKKNLCRTSDGKTSIWLTGISQKFIIYSVS